MKCEWFPHWSRTYVVAFYLLKDEKEGLNVADFSAYTLLKGVFHGIFDLQVFS